MAIDYDPGEYIVALGNISSLLGKDAGLGSANIANLNNVGRGRGSFLGNIANILKQQQGPVLGPDEFGSYTIPVSDPTYTSGFNYARSIAGGIPMSQVIAPGVSYSPEQPGGYTQAQLNTAVGTTPVETPPPPPVREPDDPRYFGTGIGGVNIPVDRKDIPFRNIFGGVQIPNVPPVSGLQDIGKLFDFDFDREAIEKIVQERIAENMPTIEQPDFSQFVRREDIPTLIPEVPTGRDFSIDRQALIEDIRAGIDIPKYEAPDLSRFVRQEDIPSLIPSVPTGREFSIDMPDVSKFVTQEDINRAIASINIPTYEAPDLSGIDTRLADLERGLLDLREPTGGRFSVQQQRPMGLFA